MFKLLLDIKSKLINLVEYCYKIDAKF